MRIHILSYLAVLFFGLSIAELFLFFIPLEHWWVAYIPPFIISVFIHEPVYKWMDKNAPR